MKKKIIKIICIFLIAFIAFVGIENIIRNLSNVSEQIKHENELKKEKEEYEKTEEYIIETYLDKCIQKTLDYLNQGDYETLYRLLDSNYKDYMQFTTIDSFKSFLDKYIGNPNSVSLVSYYKDSGKYICKISVTNEQGYRTYTILITPLGEESFNVIFDNISRIEKLDSYRSCSSENINAYISYKVRYLDGVMFSIDLTNKSSKTINTSLAETYLQKANKKRYYPINTEDLNIEIQPNETVRAYIKINDTGETYFEDQALEILLKDSEGKEVLNNRVVLASEYWE